VPCSKHGDHCCLSRLNPSARATPGCANRFAPAALPPAAAPSSRSGAARPVPSMQANVCDAKLKYPYINQCRDLAASCARLVGVAARRPLLLLASDIGGIIEYGIEYVSAIEYGFEYVIGNEYLDPLRVHEADVQAAAKATAAIQPSLGLDFAGAEAMAGKLQHRKSKQRRRRRRRRRHPLPCYTLCIFVSVTSSTEISVSGTHVDAGSLTRRSTSGSSSASADASITSCAAPTGCAV